MKDHEDFQRQFTSVMENLLHAAVSETTKLFENAVQEMKAELVRLKKQDCNFELEISSEDNPAPISNKNPCTRDVGIQCVTPTLLERPRSPPVHGENDKDRFLGLPPGLLQYGNQQLAVLLIKQEDADMYDYSSACIFPKLTGDQLKSCLVQRTQAPVTSQEADQSPSNETTAPHTHGHDPTPSPSHPVQEPAPSAPVEMAQSREFNPLDSLQVSLDLMPDIQEGNSAMPPPPPAPSQADAADQSISATPIAIVKIATLKSEPIDCEIDQQNFTNKSHPLTHQDKPRGPSTRQSKSKRCRVVTLETTQPQAKNPRQEKATDDTTFQKRQAVVSLTHCDTSPKPSKAVPQKRPRHSGGGHVGKNQCDVCMRTLSSASALQSHRLLHTGERPFGCDRCDKTFTSARGLNRHVRVHTGGRPHQCAQCGKSFVYQFNLTSHELTHGSKRPYSCGVCGKRFLSKPELTTHSRVHTNEKPYKCTLCGKKFKYRMSYNTHTRGHHGDLRYKCTVCGKAFVDPSNLNTHKRIHTGEKPYKCKECGKTFTQSGHLKKHITTQH